MVLLLLLLLLRAAALLLNELQSRFDEKVSDLSKKYRVMVVLNVTQ